MQNNLSSQTGINNNPNLNKFNTQDQAQSEYKPVHQKKYGLLLVVLLLIIVIGMTLVAQRMLQPQSKKQVAVTSPVQSTRGPTDQPVVQKDATSLEKIAMSHNKFAFDLLHESYRNIANADNLVISPSSVSFAMNMVYHGAAGITKQELEQALYLESITDEEIQLANKQLLSSLISDKSDLKVQIANSLWIANSTEYVPNYVNQMKDYYQADNFEVDFTSQESINQLNKWVEINTNGKIQKFFEYPMSQADLITMILVDTVYFKGDWTKPFEASSTLDMPFTMADSQQNIIPMMYQNDYNYDYLKNNELQMIRLPYGEDERFAMYLLLPTQDNIYSFVNNLNYNQWVSWRDNLEKTLVKLYLPKFEVKQNEINMKEMLQNLGIKRAFTDNADFTKMLTTESKISEVKQATYLKLAEKGTEAAAATQVVMMEIGAAQVEQVETMKVNKPFMFILEDSESSEMLFMGVIHNPVWED